MKTRYKKAILNNKTRKFILLNNIFNDIFNTRNDKNYKFNSRMNEYNQFKRLFTNFK